MAPHSSFIKAFNVALDLTTIVIFVVFALLYALLLPARWRGWALFVGSVIAIYWLQPDIRVRFLDFMLPTATLLLTIATWVLTRAKAQIVSRSDYLALFIIIALIIGLSLFRLVPAQWRLLVASRPPNPVNVFFIFAACLFLISLLAHRLQQPQQMSLILLVIVVIFIVLKTEPLAASVSGFFRHNAGQDVSLASAFDLHWLGFSYVAFRLLHTIHDRQTGLLPQLTLHEYVTYVVFFPSFISGPIDRAERFVDDFRTLPDKAGLDSARIVEAATRIMMGLFKKFVIADTLAQGMALDPVNASQAVNTWGLWLLLYGYAFRLFFDFSGYTDIVIGIGILFGIKLPENFNRPYLITNITKFWQSWHITLSNWARFYVFSPLSRTLLTRKPKPSPVLIVLITQLATMIVIGLWHGVTLNFLIWGLWHGIALFVHKQWSGRTRRVYRRLKQQPLRKGLWDTAAWFITFHYVVVGWVWFALPDFDLSLRVFALLFAVGG